MMKGVVCVARTSCRSSLQYLIYFLQDVHTHTRVYGMRWRKNCKINFIILNFLHLLPCIMMHHRNGSKTKNQRRQRAYKRGGRKTAESDISSTITIFISLAVCFARTRLWFLSIKIKDCLVHRVDGTADKERKMASKKREK